MLVQNRIVQAGSGEQAPVHRRVQCLDPAVHDLGKAGNSRDILNVETRGAQRRGGAAGRDHGHAQSLQLAGEFGQAPFVGDA